MGNLKLSRESIERLIASESVDDFTFVDNVYEDEWRWGSKYLLVFKDSSDNYWGYRYKERAGDEFWASYMKGEEKEEVTAYPVEAITVTTYRLVSTKS